MNDARFNMILPEELLKKINEEAKRKCISSASLVRMVLAEYFERKEQERRE